MTLKINKACDLSSISVFPPPSRRSKVASSGADPPSSAPRTSSQQPPPQLRSQSQPSFSQGMPLSQLSQTSFDERLDSQERDQSCRRISSLVPLGRDDSQMQLTRSSNTAMRRWNSAPAPESKCTVGEEMEHRFGLMQTSLTRLGKLLDSVQSDVIQVNRAVREVMLETECIRQKMHLQDSLLQTMLKKEEDIKESLDRNLKSNSERLKNEVEQNKLTEISSALSALPDKIAARIMKLQNELYGAFLCEIKETARIWKEAESKSKELVFAPPSRNVALKPQPCQPSSMHMKSHPTSRFRRSYSVKKEDCSVSEVPACSFKNKNNKRRTDRELPATERDKDFWIAIESDDEIESGFSFSAGKRTRGGDIYLTEEAKEETLRLLRKARRRKRKFDNTVLLD